MRRIFYFIVPLLSFAAILPACQKREQSGSMALVQAEQAFGERRYSVAQQLADSVVASPDFDNMYAGELCRLSMLLLRLSETGSDEYSNLAMASRSLEAAMARDSDSTAAFILQVPVDDHGRIALLKAISDAYRGVIVDGDTILMETDTIEH